MKKKIQTRSSSRKHGRDSDIIETDPKGKKKQIKVKEKSESLQFDQEIESIHSL
jgi:hypothetical protein